MSETFTVIRVAAALAGVAKSSLERFCHSLPGLAGVLHFGTSRHHSATASQMQVVSVPFQFLVSH